MIFLLIHFTPYRKFIRSGTFKAPKTTIPLKIFGDGMHGKDNVHFKGHRREITDKLYRQLKRENSLANSVLLTFMNFGLQWQVLYMKIRIKNRRKET